MADEYTTSGNWWERNRFEAATPSSTSSGLTSVGSFGWLMDMAPAASSATAHDMKSTSSPNSSSIDHSLGGMGFHDPNKLNLGGDGAETNLQMMSSQTVDWNQQTLLRGDKPGDQIRFPGQEQVSVGSSQVQWRPASSESFIMQNQHSGFDNSLINGGYSNSYQANYNGLLSSDHEQLLPPNWSKVPQFLRATPRKPSPSANSGQLHFSNNWSASTAANSPPMIDVRPSFLSPIHKTQFSSPNFEEKPNKLNLLEVSTKPSKTIPKKSGSQTTNKRPRNEAQAPLPAFKVRKEKVGDRITTLQQLVSPFGKTDTASVLTEAIDYIKFLHDKVHELSIPYMKNGVTMILHHQNFEKSKLDLEEPKQDLQSRGLCLVPLSSTYPVCTAQETNFDFWNPTLGGTFR